ncbi:phosphoribosyltransferase family protein [Aneurinibacillus terranovensis]|uniref:phosphoribosyltransferase family protein n=1 Tax=Aneurinibacillus terranovensis TaxID=278991 RepID=UPI0004854F82|nr:phosphoribosyltransferase family protein [Aneurinibacillus terranovensis]
MKGKTIPVCLPEKYTYHIEGGIDVCVQIEDNPYNIPLEELFAMAARRNKKRNFLFVSKILGKHIPVDPYVPLLAGAVLAARYIEIVYQTGAERARKLVQALRNPEQRPLAYARLRQMPLELPRDIVVVGFAETATALGSAVFDSFAGRARYLHTTRESINEIVPEFTFEEEHSHATSHRCYTLDGKFFAGSEPVVLVDDEITTGKTALNIIAELQHRYPRKEYVLASLLDWRAEEDRLRFREMEKKLGIRIRCVSLVSGRIAVRHTATLERPEWLENPERLEKPENREIRLEVINQALVVKANRFTKTAIKDKKSIATYLLSLGESLPFSSSDTAGNRNSALYLRTSGRFGMTSSEAREIDKDIEKVAFFLRGTRKGKRTLCMGTGEFMFIPMRIAALMGEGISYQSTTRSPIYQSAREGYAIQNAFSYSSPDDPAITNYFYNVRPGMYDELYLFVERESEAGRMEPLLDQLRSLGIPRLSLVIFNGKGGGVLENNG